MEVVPLVAEAPHARMVIAPTEEAQEVGAAEDDASARGADADRLGDEAFRILHMFHHVQCTDSLEIPVRVGESVAVIQQASVGEGLGALDVRCRDIHAVRLEALLGQLGHDLADAASDVQHPGTRCLGAKGFGELGVEGRVPVGQDIGIGQVIADVVEMAGRGGHGQSALEGLGAKMRMPTRRKPVATAARLTHKVW